jgi:hypothetical protein
MELKTEIGSNLGFGRSLVFRYKVISKSIAMVVTKINPEIDQ